MAWLKELQGLGKLMEPWNNHLITAQAIMMEAVSYYEASTQDLQSFIVEGVCVCLGVCVLWKYLCLCMRQCYYFYHAFALMLSLHIVFRCSRVQAQHLQKGPHTVIVTNQSSHTNITCSASP